MKVEPEGFLYIPDFLSVHEQATLLRELQSLIYKHDVFRGQKLKRGSAQFGYSYVSTGRKLDVAPMTPAFLQTLIKKASPYYPNDIMFTQCIVTHYPSGAGIGWHTDAPQFGDYIIVCPFAYKGKPCCGLKEKLRRLYKRLPRRSQQQL